MSDVTTYQVRYRKVGAIDWQYHSVPEADLTEVLDGLDPDSTYELAIVAYNDEGSTVTQPVVFTTGSAAPGAPGTPVAIFVGPTSVVLNWSPSSTGTVPITYQVQYRVHNTGLYVPFGAPSSLLSETVTGLTDNTSYDFQVVATNAVNATVSGTLTVSTHAVGVAPTAPTGLIASNLQFTSIDLAWSASTGDPTITYQPRYRVAGVGSYVNFGSPISGLSVTITGLVAATSYEFIVVAANAFGSNSSAPLVAATAAPPTETIGVRGVGTVIGRPVTRQRTSLAILGAGSLVPVATWRAIGRAALAGAGTVSVDATAGNVQPGITINAITSAVTGEAFTVTGVLVGYGSAPTLQYTDDSGIPPVSGLGATTIGQTNVVLGWQPDAVALVDFPVGASVTATTFSFVHPGMTAGSHTLTVTDGIRVAHLTYTVASRLFSVQGVATVVATARVRAAAYLNIFGLSTIVANPNPPAGSSTTFDPAFKNAGMTLSNGNRTAVATTVPSGVRSLGTPRNSGKLYFEMRDASGNNFQVGCGLGNASVLVGNLPIIGFDSVNSVGIYPYFFGVFINGAEISRHDDWTNTDVGTVQCAVDLDAKLLWVTLPGWRSNGLGWNRINANPTAGTGGYAIGAVAAGPYYIIYKSESSVSTATLAVSSAQFELSPPTGFTPWG